MQYLLLSAVFVVALTLTFAPPDRAAGDDVATVRQRLYEDLASPSPGAQHVRQLMQSQQDDGSWPDIDYADRTKGGWAPHAHLTRMKDLAEAYRHADNPLAGNEDLRRALHAALNYWLEHDPTGKNWWNNEIGTPRGVAETMVLLGEELTGEQLQRGRKILQRAKIGMTGQN
ncbi:MAG: hypothetical protein ACOC93_02610, partial [Planctomycetota bacterium]